MPTQKIDPKVIFASDAPAIDKPPVFSDKTKGWDVARANDGRPQIKEMNKVQQDTDLKILWLNENAVLPYDETIDYPDGAVTLKDGSFKQLSGGEWVEFLDDFADKDAVKRGIANRYDSSLTYNSGERVVLANGDIAKSTIDGNTNDPSEIKVIKPNTLSWFNETLASTNLHETQARLLDFIPKQYHAEIFAGTSTRDFSSYINYATNEIRGDLIFPRGVVTCAQPILLNRGIRLLGNGPFDTITKGSSRIKLLGGSNCPLITTPLASGVGTATHYMALENLMIDGNNKEQTVMSTLVQMHGAWIGSWIRNVFIADSYGTALELDRGADLEIDHLWISGSVVGDSKYAFNSNPSYVGTSLRGGLLNANHLYIEGTAIEKLNGSNDPIDTPSNRGDAVNLNGFVSVNINEIHIERSRRMIDIRDGHSHRIGKVSVSGCGLSSLTDQAIVRVCSNNLRSLTVGTAVITARPEGSIYGVRKSSGLTFNAFPNAPLANDTWSTVNYSAINSYTPECSSVSAPIAVRKELNVIKDGGNVPRVKLNDSDDLLLESKKYSGIKLVSSGVGLYSAMNQTGGAETVLLDIVTPAISAGNAVRAYAPIVMMDERTVSNSIGAGALTKISTTQGKGLAYSFSASSFNFLASVVTGTATPTVTPNHIGQMFVDTVNKKFYSASGIASSEDWVLLN